MLALPMGCWLAFSTVFLVDAPGGSPRDRQATASAARSAAAPTAEEILRALRKSRPPNDVIPPGSASTDSPAPVRPKRDALLWPEGSTWIEKTGRLDRDGDWWRFQSESDPAERPIRLLPNTNLEVLVRTIRGGSPAERFVVSGEITVFEDANYLLVRSAVRASPPTVPTPPSASAERPPPSSGARPRTDAPADQVLDRMRASQPQNPVLAEEAPPKSNDQPATSPPRSANLILDGTPVVRRVGRVTRQEGGWMFASDSDRADPADAPIRMLPNQSLETMVKESQSGSGGLVFTVSGEATLFFGENYLLPRVATRRVDLGNLRR